MKPFHITLIFLFIFNLGVHAAPDEPRPLRIIAFGAHPDDAEYQMAGTAIKWAKLGHKVKLVSVTNGDIGHWRMSGGELAKVRTAECKEAARRMGPNVESLVMDIHDGELMPTLENRKKVARLIRDWKADIVLSHRPYDYHPDHRYVGVLVRDAAFMVTVPFYVPDTEHLKKNPLFLYFPDRFTRPYPFQADITVAIDDVMDDKVHAIDALITQAYERGVFGSEEKMKKDRLHDLAFRKKVLHGKWKARNGRIAGKYKDTLVQWYGEEAAEKVEVAEAFEVCEYGRMPSKEEILELFPFLPQE